MALINIKLGFKKVKNRMRYIYIIQLHMYTYNFTCIQNTILYFVRRYTIKKYLRRVFYLGHGGRESEMVIKENK